MRILLAWELGGNYGHISKLLYIARHIRQRGHQILFVVKDTKTAGQLLDNEKFRYVQSPRSAVRAKRFRRPVSFADILAGAGFSSSEVLDGLVRSWRQIFKNFQPHVVVAQYAPVAQVAARLSGLPCLTLNTGFECPPYEAPFPSLRAHLKLTRKQLLDREAEILKYVNRVNVREGYFSCNSLQEVLKSDINLLATFPEMDHYRQRPDGCYIGPLSLLNNGVTIRWRARSSLRIFVYLRPFPGIVAILEALAASGADVIAHIPGLDAGIRTSYTNTSIRVVDSTVRLSDILADMDVAITHAGHGTACAALLAGVPLLMIPTTIEQWLTSCNVEALGAGMSLKKGRVAQTFTVALDKLPADHSYREGAKKMAEKYSGYDQERVIARIVNTIERLPGWVANRSGEEFGRNTKIPSIAC